jgi:hypothetical protein
MNLQKDIPLSSYKADSITEWVMDLFIRMKPEESIIVETEHRYQQILCVLSRCCVEYKARRMSKGIYRIWKTGGYTLPRCKDIINGFEIKDDIKPPEGKYFYRKESGRKWEVKLNALRPGQSFYVATENQYTAVYHAARKLNIPIRRKKTKSGRIRIFKL